MKAILVSVALVLLVGCGPYKTTVYGAKGTPYIAPDLCAAQLACENAGESSCYYPSDTQTVIDPQTEKKAVTVYGCHKLATGKP